MTLDDAGSLDAARQVEGLKIRQIPPDDVGAHVAIGAKGFGVTEQLYGQLSTPAAMRLPGVRCYVGEVAGTPVTTGLGVTLAPFVAIFSIATPPAYRGRGYASAVTARAVGDGLANGAEWAWLQSSEAARQIYTRLGFRTVELWDCWVAANGQ
jgi:ribosomal protein S18 acetylase RimI-like enzyme